MAIAQSGIADVSSKEDRGRLFGYIYLSASSAYIVGPLVGGKLADPELVSWFSYATPFWGVCGLLALTLAWCTISLRESHTAEAETSRGRHLAGQDHKHRLKGVLTLSGAAVPSSSPTPPRVEPTNNHGERLVRSGVLWRKIAFGCHSERGCRFVERILTVVGTLRLQKRPVLDFLYRSLLAHRNGDTPPTLV